MWHFYKELIWKKVKSRYSEETQNSAAIMRSYHLEKAMTSYSYPLESIPLQNQIPAKQILLLEPVFLIFPFYFQQHFFVILKALLLISLEN